MSDLRDQKAHARDIFLDDFAQKGWMHRVRLAQAFGLDPDKYARPFPGSTFTTTYQTQRSGIGSKLGSLLAGAALTAGGLLGGQLLDKPAEPAPAEATAAADAGAKVRVFWGDQEILPGQDATSGTLKVEPAKE